MKATFNTLNSEKQIILQDILSANNESEEFTSQAQFLKYNLVKTNKSFYVPKKFSLDNLINQIKQWLENEQDRKTEIDEIGDIKTLNYQLTKGFKSSLGLAGNFQLFLLQNQNELIYDIKPAKWLAEWDKQSSFSFKKFVQNSLEDEIETKIIEILKETYFNKIEEFTISKSNRYIENIKPKEELLLLTSFEENEILLAYLEISSVKKLPNEQEVNKNLDYKYLLTNKNSFLLGLNSDFTVEEVYELKNEKIFVKKSISRDDIEVSDFEWVANISNGKYYREIETLTSFESYEKVYHTAKQNWLYGDKKEADYKFIQALLKYVLEARKSPYDQLSIFFVEFLNKEKETVLEDFAENEKLATLFTDLLAEENLSDKITTWKNYWNLSTNQEIIILRLLLNFAENEKDYQKILKFHQEVRDKFLKLEKDKLNIIIFESEYCKHLIDCQQEAEASKILHKRLKELPDETLSDLLPSEDVDITSNAGGQILKITILELLADAENTENSVEHIKQVAMLQPLAKERLDVLISVSENELKKKAEIVRQMLEPESIKEPDNIFEDVKYQKLKPKQLEKLKHPAARKGGMFGSLQNWLANVKVPDYSVVKSFSEPLTSRKYPEISNIVTDIKHAFGLENVETYIAHGDKSIGVTSFEGSPAFLIVGAEHLDEESPYFLNFSELEFVIGLELAHLHFKHSRITSSDVWRGAMEKGTWVLDTIVSVIPFVGSIGKAVQQVPKLALLAKTLQNSEKIARITSKSVQVLEKSSQAVNLLQKIKKPDSQTEKKQELIAIARMLQLTADRAGLLFTGDLKSAVRTIFLSSKTFAQEFELANRYGINEFLLKKDSEGNYKNQELAIRFASLFSFYLSDDYDMLRKALIKQ